MMNNRRKLLLGVGAMATPFVCLAQGQVKKVARVGVLSPLTARAAEGVLGALRARLVEFGWVEGRNLYIEVRYAEEKYDRLSTLASELARSNVDVIVTGATPGALAALKATRTIPIVAVSTGDFVASGLVVSLARPGANLTGVTTLGRELSVKRLSLLKETLPAVTQVAVLANPENPETSVMVSDLRAAARSLKIRLQFLEARTLGEIEKAFGAMSDHQVGALLLLTDLTFYGHRTLIVDFALKRSLAAIFPFEEMATNGGLMYYGASLIEMYRHAATYVDKILKGARPAELPVEQPTKFELVVNVRTAKRLGLSIPPEIMVQATRVIQ
jgi:putative ABC transport system substrate-binding protein